MNDDEKVKIFDGEKEECEACDTDSLLTQMLVQKENGNLDKARNLGRMLAEECIKKQGEFEFGLDVEENSQVLLQRHLLLAFTIQFGLQKFCTNSIVEKTAENQFFSILQEKAPQTYATIREEGAFSFYTLCMRSARNQEECVAKTFAELCMHKDEDLYMELGKALFLHFLDLIEKKIKQLDFS